MMASDQKPKPGKGYIHLYTGNGKGKTTAAFGQALRAAGSGLKVFIGQFVKGRPYGEIEAVKSFLPDVTVRQFGLDCFIVNLPTDVDIRAAGEGLETVRQITSADQYNVVILDEITIALHYHLFTTGEVLEIMKNKPSRLELILTGRYAPQEIIEACDLVTEMKEVKHYYTKGIEARKGIEF